MTGLTHLQRLEAESIHILREVVAETERPVMLYSVGKDSACMLHLAKKAFYPAPPPFPLLHVDTTWKFRAMYDLRDKAARDAGLMQKVCAAIDKDTFWYVLASRLAVVVPFHMINIAAGVMAARLKPYTVATVIGLLPAHTIYCWIGARLNTLLVTDPDPDFQALFGQFWAPMTGVFVLAVVLPVALKALQGALGRKAAT